MLLISAAKPAMPFDEEPADLDVLSTLTIAACLTRAGELSRGFLVGGCSLGAVSLSSEEREVGAGGLAFLFPFEERRDIKGDRRDWRKLSSLRNEKRGEVDTNT